MKRPRKNVARTPKDRNGRNAILFFMHQGELHYSQRSRCQEYVDKAEVAIERLLKGEAVWVLMYGPMITQIQQAIERMRVDNAEATPA